MYERYKNEIISKEYDTKEDKEILNQKYNIICWLEEALDIESKVDWFFKNVNTVKNFIDYKTIDEIYILSSFVRKHIYTIEIFVLKNGVDYSNIRLVSNIIVVLNLISKLQQLYVDFMYNRCNLKELEVFNTKESEKYQRMINNEVSKLELKNI